MSGRVMLMAAAFATVSSAFSFKAAADDLRGGAASATSPRYFDIQADPAPASTGASTPASPTTPVNAAPSASTQRPLMMLLDKAGVAQPLNDARINFYGWIEGSYTYSPTNAAKLPQLANERILVDRLFDIEDNVARLNQLDLTVERKVDYTSNRWDFGFRAEAIYGGDSRFIHANGLDFYGDTLKRPNPGLNQPNGTYNIRIDPLNQFDLFQAYVDIGVPVGNGLRVRIGKFESLFGGTVDPNQNSFYSRTSFFATFHPFTFTGVKLTYAINDQIFVDGGLSVGWDQALRDNNSAIDGFARGTFFLSDSTTLGLAAVTGPEQTHDDADYRTLIELSLKYKATDQLQFTLDADYAWQPHYNGNAGYTDPFSATGNLYPARQDVRIYDLSGYVRYTLNRNVELNARLEFYRDEEGAGTGIRGSAYSLTLGSTLTPFAGDPVGGGFKVRPEVRYDFSPENRYDGVSKHDQLTLAIDAIFNF